MANVPYSQGVADVKPDSGGTGATYGDVPQANAAAFGAGIGEAEQGVGQQTNQLAQKFADIYNESTARDAATKTATDMATEQARFMQLKGNDAVAGLKQHQDNLNQIVQANSQGLSLNANQMFQKDASFMVDRALYSAGAHVGEQAEAAEKTSLKGAIDSGVNGFAMNPNDPSNIHKIFDNSISLDHANGVGDKDVVNANASANFGKAFTNAIEANQYSNPDLANKLYDQAMTGSYVAPDGTKIPFLDASQRAVVSEKMHSANEIMNANAVFSNIMAGNKPPPPIGGGMNEVNVKATVAANAQKAGNDPNVAMMIAGLESSFGRTSANIGGVKGDGTMEEKQAEATTVANNVVGGNATPAQIYIAYQQGPGGGAALLKTLQTNPNASAVDVLTPLYKDDAKSTAAEKATSALTGNGMPANATVKQVTDFLQKKCDDMYGQVACNTVDANGKQIDVAQAITKPYQTPGAPAQPTSNPVEAMKQFNDLYSSRQAQIDSLPSGSKLQKDVQEQLNAIEAHMKKAVDVYNEQNTSAIREITSQPDFYSVNDSRITPDMRSFMNQDQKAYDAVYRQAERNRLVAKGEAGGKTPFGDGFSYLQKQAYDGKLNTTDLFYHMDNDLTQAGFDKLKGVVEKQSSPQPDGDVASRAEFYKNVHDIVVHNSVFGNTADAETAYQKWFDSVSNTVESKKDQDLADILDPTSRNYAGKNIHQFIPPTQQQLAVRAQAINGRMRTTPNTSQERAPGESPEAYLARIMK